MTTLTFTKNLDTPAEVTPAFNPVHLQLLAGYDRLSDYGKRVLMAQLGGLLKVDGGPK